MELDDEKVKQAVTKSKDDCDKQKELSQRLTTVEKDLTELTALVRRLSTVITKLEERERNKK